MLPHADSAASAVQTPKARTLESNGLPTVILSLLSAFPRMPGPAILA